MTPEPEIRQRARPWWAIGILGISDHQAGWCWAVGDLVVGWGGRIGSNGRGEEWPMGSFRRVCVYQDGNVQDH